MRRTRSGRRLLVAGASTVLVLLAATPAQTAPSTSFTVFGDPDMVPYSWREPVFLDSSNRPVYGRVVQDGVEVRFEGGPYDSTWEVAFYPARGKRLTTGYYSSAFGSSYRDQQHPGLDIRGDGYIHGGGTFEIKDVAWGSDGSLERLWAVFVVQGKFGAASFGEVRYNAEAPSGRLHATPSRVRWPSADLERVPATVPIRVAPGGNSVNISSVAVSGGDSGSFTVVADDCSARSVPSGSFCEVRVAFRPTSPGTRASALRITDSEGGVIEVPLEGYTYGGRTHFLLESDAGDYIGQGQIYEYDPGDGTLSASADAGGGGFGVRTVEDWWSGEFVPPEGETLRTGFTYTGAERYPYNGEGPGLTVIGNGRGCDQSRGSFTVHVLEVDTDGRATEMDLSFEQHCNYEDPAFHGRIQIRVGNDVPPPPWGLPYTPANSPSETASVRLTPSKASRRAAGRKVRPRARPRPAAPQRVVNVGFESRARLGPYRGRRRLYQVNVRVRGPGKPACIQRASGYINSGRRDNQLKLHLNPRRMKGARWCRGRFRGAVRYIDTFACPATGTCNAPSGFKRLDRRVGRFTFRVR